MRSTMKARLFLLGMVAAVSLPSACNDGKCNSRKECLIGELCNADGVCIPPPVLTEVPCHTEENSAVFDLDTAFAVGSTKWVCPTPVEVGAPHAVISDVSGQPFVVSGGTLQLEVSWSGEPSIGGRTIFFGTERDGYFAKTLPATVSSPFDVELFVRPGTPGGLYTFIIGVDDGTGTQDDLHPGNVFRMPFTVVPVKTGDIQVSVSWDTICDVDLHVLSPVEDTATGEREELYWQQKIVGSEGELDLDSNPACSNGPDDVENENVFWPTDKAPDGEYLVRLDLYDACTPVIEETNWTVTILKDLQVDQVIEGQFTAADADQGSAGSGRDIATITYP